MTAHMMPCVHQMFMVLAQSESTHLALNTVLAALEHCKNGRKNIRQLDLGFSLMSNVSYRSNKTIQHYFKATIAKCEHNTSGRSRGV